METTTREELVAAHLRYGPIAEPLRERGYAQVVAKALFMAGRGTSLTPAEICEVAEDVLQDWRPREEDVISALEFLDGEGLLRQESGSHALAIEAWHELAEQLQERRRRLRAIYERYFPNDIALDQFRSWFDWACIDFFTEYGNRWVATVVRDASLLPTRGLDLRGLLSSSIREHGFEDQFGELVDGFRLFLRSNEQEDQNHLWSLGRAMFAARLAAAGTGADPLTQRALANSTVLLDTNTLLDIALEERVHGKAVQALGRALSAIDVDLRYTSETEAEYQGHLDGKAGDALRSIRKFGIPLARDTGDEAILTALSRGCSTEEDFEEFFEEIRELPTEVNGSIPIELLDTPEAARAGREGWENDAQVEEIQLFGEQRGRTPKDDLRARHDSALTEVTRALRASDTNCWILSRDSTMTALAVSWCGPTSAPLWVGLDALLQVLAVGEEGDSSDFATIFASLVANEVEVSPTTYELADLRYLDERHAQIAALPDEDVKELASFVYRRRLGGAKMDDSELRLELSRNVQERVSRQLAEAGEARAEFESLREESRLAAQRVEAAQEEADRVRRRADEKEAQLINERANSLVGQIERTFWLRLLSWFGWTAAVIALAIGAYFWVLPDLSDRLDFFVVIGALATPVLSTVLGLFTRVLPWKQKEMRDVRSNAERQLREEGLID